MASRLLELSPHVYLTRVGFTNVVVIAEEDVTVIDTGMRGGEKRILEAIEELGRSSSQIANILVTHHHFDHCGALARLRQLSCSKVFAHRDEIPYINGELPPARFIYTRPLGGILWPMLSRFVRVEATEVDVPLTDGQYLDPLGGLRVVHTPGHTPGSVCFYSPERRLLVAGDALTNFLRRVSLPPFTANMTKARESVCTLAQLDFEVLCLGHGPPVLHEAAERVKRLAGMMAQASWG